MTRPREADVVVIGSGFGGSVAANLLASAGRQVLVLERGPWRDSLPVQSMGIERRAPFPSGLKLITHLLRTLHIGRCHLTLNKRGMYEAFSYPGIFVAATSAVGGGSTAWGGLLAPPRDPSYWHGRHPDLEPSDIEKYYDKILLDMGASRLSREQWLPNSIWAQLPASAGQKCRPTDVQHYVTIKFPATELEVGQVTRDTAGVSRRNSAFDGDGFLGSQGGAKASVDFTYLAPVLGKGATVRDLCEVTAILPDQGAGGGYSVHFTDLHRNAREVVRARQVVLAAGTMNTLRLLFASSERPDGLHPMPSLGHRFGANGDLFGAWFKKDIGPSSFKSPPILGSFEVAGQDAVSLGMGGFPGFDTLPLPGMLKRMLARITMLVGMGADSGKASVTFKKGALRVHYDPQREPIFESIRASFRSLEAESGLKTWALKKPMTVHQWGGACLGSSAGNGVVDHRGEVYGNRGLFIADAAALPAAVGAPPSLAVAAWAHHVACQLMKLPR